jgi:flagellar FliJ protein
VTRPPFNFRLERVRALRETVEDQAREELATSLSLRMRGEAMLRAATNTMDDAREARRSVSAATAQELVAIQAYIERTQRAREAAALELDRRDAEVEARRSALQSASRDRQVLERLKERQRTGFEREVERRESALLDEVAITAHRRAEATR